jgi:HD-GYP domain-containing protein (c-di-GMP phosphodiesterase class II)
VFEAITSKRHYRNPMPENVALGIIAHQSGKHFDGEIVRAFFRYYNKLKTGDKKQIDLLRSAWKKISVVPFQAKGLRPLQIISGV